jgi:hypothetical protein
MKRPDRDEVNELAAALKAIGNLHLEISAGSALALIGALQLACRHPGFVGPTRREVEGLARTLQRRMAAESDLVGRVLERGWYPVFDHRPDPERTPGVNP